ncbi:ABC transporter ATP-binding protein [Haloplanus aerogenes]|uniref:ABC transporter ATP-binding protein n=1 Tax=Haloplanus aerogenes TaxID=660522 RepID=A0A3M0DQZ7_9EURY|nr:ABC transporter ATP-binding protein [Haloplanus aerogenes]AZH24431.1 ABC transporter ATP-binding protein [Haloplanus aerogenes]RMB23924.1 ABC-2 type transport system ATP-binding protein [Haloplanus aerogenes]
MAAIEVQGLTKAYGDTLANDHLDFSIERGEIFGYLGPNGAGKSTTIRQLMGFQAPTEGTARIFGHDVRNDRELRQAKARIGFLPGEPAFTPSVTGAELLDYQAALKGDERRDELLDIFTPPLDRQIREYSTGNKQMLGIVQAFMHDPDLLIMDEPTSGLDPLKQEAFHAFLREERDRGKTIFFSSHILGEVRRVCDRVGIIREGRLVTVEAVDDLLERGGKQVRVHTAEPVTEADFDVDGIVGFEAEGRQAQFTFTGDYNDLFAALADHRLVDIEIDEPPIEEVFMHFYGGEE